MGCCDSFSRNKIDTLSFHNPKSKKTINFFPPSDSKLATEYQILTTLKKNQFSNFKKIVHISTNRVFILQTISKEGLLESDIQQLVKHLTIIKDFRHENIVEIEDFLADEANFYLILEFFDEAELFDKISKEGVFRETEAKKIMKGLLEAIDYAHKRNIVHGDIRPENLISSLKLTNFFPLPFLLPPPSFYSSPQTFILPPSKKSDIWACGVLLYMILCGSLPFLAFSREGLEECVKKDDWKRKNGEWMEISAGARDLIGKMLEVREEERTTAEEALRHEWFSESSSSRSSKNHSKSLNKSRMQALLCRLIENINQFFTNQDKEEKELQQAINFIKEVESPKLKKNDETWKKLEDQSQNQKFNAEKDKNSRRTMKGTEFNELVKRMSINPAISPSSLSAEIHSTTSPPSYSQLFWLERVAKRLLEESMEDFDPLEIIQIEFERRRYINKESLREKLDKVEGFSIEELETLIASVDKNAQKWMNVLTKMQFLDEGVVDGKKLLDIVLSIN